PRILFLDADLPVTELIDRFREYQHPRIPVYQGHWDNVIGFLHSEDILRLIQGGGDLEQVTLEMIIKPAHFVPPTKKVDEMFDYFQAHNTRVAIVLGEYGEVLGIVTMKDVLTFIFGEISGKMVGLEYYQEEDENSYVVPGDMRLSDFYNLTNFDIEDPVMSTIAGVAFRLFDRLPKEGDKVRYEGYEFIAREVTGLRISKIQVRKIVADEERPQESVDDESEPTEAVDESLDRQDETIESEPDGDTSEQDSESAPADDDGKKETIDSGGAR
ncbi:MAG: CBS domain-containing protein, partial [Candidatus Thiodiazotropha taylori]|nr:CBS domain-containing protein [Candidatus Thiodiazotropha taylori]